MKFNVYTVYDEKVKEFCPPFIQREGAVERSLQQLVKSSPIPACDLVLHIVGTWDSEEGLLSVSHDIVGNVANILGIVEKEVSE